MLGGKQEQQYRDLFDQQMALNIARGRGLGLAPMIERQLLANLGLSDEQPPALDRSLDRYANRVPSRRAASQTPDAAAAPAVTEKPSQAEKGPVFEKPEDFVRAVWAAAERTAKRFGGSARALVAQAALETGWGQHVMRRADGSSTFNLFGIKAHRDWSGDTVKVPTLEFRNGAMRREVAEFRAYRSIEESFEDYLQFLHSHPRYQRALEVADDPEAYVQALQEAGYATDPDYAEKITRIMKSATLSAVAADASDMSA